MAADDGVGGARDVTELARELSGVAVGVSELTPPLEDLGALADALLSSFVSLA